MKISTSNILVMVGGSLIISPLAFLYFTYRLSADFLDKAMEHGKEWDKVNFSPPPPEYYIPLCLIIGIVCIGFGVFLSWTEKKDQSLDQYQKLGIN